MKQLTALQILNSGANVFLTGSAGAGKSYTTTQFIKAAQSKGLKVAVSASTGIAAVNVGGVTIHSLLGMGISDSTTPEMLKKLSSGRKADKIRKIDVIIVDEISMLHRKQFEMADEILRFVRNSSKPFGGVQIVIVGDFFQLPPVGKPGEETRDKFVFMSPLFKDADFKVCYLTEQHRNGSGALNTILNEVRAQKVSQSSIDILKAQANKTLDCINLYTHNGDVEKINVAAYNAIQQQEHEYIASKKGDEFALKSLIANSRTAEVLKLKVGTKVMFTANNPGLGYVNGTTGIVTKVEKYHVVVVTPEKTISVEPFSWEQKVMDEVVARYVQIPLAYAWAVTVHKSQGMSLDQASMDLSRSFEYGQGYVGLSRLRSIEGLHLKGFNETSLELDPLAIKADKRFQDLSASLAAQYGEDSESTESDADVQISAPVVVEDTEEDTPVITQEEQVVLETVVEEAEKAQEDNVLIEVGEVVAPAQKAEVSSISMKFLDIIGKDISIAAGMLNRDYGKLLSSSTGRSVANSISAATGGKISYIKDNIVVDIVVNGARFFVLYNATYDVWNIKVAKSGGK